MGAGDGAVDTGTGDAWGKAVLARIKAAIISGGQTELELGTGYGSGMCIEGFGRAYAAATGMDLGMVLPTLLAAVSFCTQGAWWAPLDKGVAGTDRIPLVFQFFGIAPSGQQKSSLLERRVLPVLDELSMRGTQERNALCSSWKKQAQVGPAVNQSLVVDEKLWEEIYGAGRCAHSIADAGTPEGLRGDLVGNGGHVGIFTAEPDVLREIRAYAKDDGSLTIFVRGWDQGNILTSRARGTIRMQECSVPFAILTQPETFEEYTQPSPGGQDPYMSRGVFSRSWLFEAPYLPMGTGTGAGMSAGQVDAATEEVAMAAVLWEAKMAELVELSNPYRAAKGIMQAWLNRPENWDEVPVPTLPKMWHRKLELDGAGKAVYQVIQKIRQGLIGMSDEMESEGPGMRAKYASWFARFTEHVLRIAALLTLADDSEALYVDAGHLRDVAERWIPWLMAAWVRVTTKRGVAVAAEKVMDDALGNVGHADLTVTTNVVRALYSLYETQKLKGPKYTGANPDEGMTVSEIAQKIKTYSRSFRKPGAYPDLVALLSEEVPKLAEEGMFVVLGPTVTEATGTVRQKYRLNNAGLNFGLTGVRKRHKKQGGD